LDSLGIPRPEYEAAAAASQSISSALTPRRGRDVIHGTTTETIRLDPERFDPSALDAPARCVREGGLVAFPTETVYGIAARRDDPGAVRRLLELRGSPEDKRLTLHIGERDQVRAHVRRIPITAQRLMARFWPGPLTIVFPDEDLGIRFPRHAVACELLKRAGVPVVAPSANRSGAPPALSAAEVPEGLDYVIDAGPTRHARASTVVRAAEHAVEVLREGAIPRTVIDEVNYFQVLFICTGNTCRSPMAAALMRKLAGDRPDLRVVSAGTAAGTGAEPFEPAIQAMRERGISLEDHRSRPVSVTLVEDSNLVFVMTSAHRDLVLEWVPEAADRIHLLDPEGTDIKDPMLGTLEVYRECAKRIEACLARRIAALPGPGARP
jgi:protein-tyrosine phosphatase